MIKKLLFACVLLFGMSAMAQIAVDPCQSNVTKSSVFANITTATTTALVAGVANTNIYICGFVVTMTGTTTADTLLFERGTGGTCGTGTTVISPTFNSGILTQGATVISYGGGGQSIMQSTVGVGVCVVSTVATSPTINLHVTYVQQ